MVRTPVWLLGLGLIALGAALHLVALAMAPITVIQPLGILAVGWSVLIAARLKGKPPERKIWFAVGVSVVGIVGFTILSTRYTTEATDISLASMLWTTAAIWGLAIVLGGFGIFGPRSIRSLCWAWAGAALYGLGSGYMKIMAEIITHGAELTGAEFITALVGLILAYGVGGWMIQTAYATGPAEVVVGSMTTVDPLAAVLVGLVVLGEGALLTPLIAMGMVLAGLVAAGGVAVLSRFHPDTDRHHPVVGADI
jgi:drug/metabolite transporter (DMT)-like permease